MRRYNENKILVTRRIVSNEILYQSRRHALSAGTCRQRCGLVARLINTPASGRRCIPPPPQRAGKRTLGTPGLAALLLPQIFPISSVVAPCQPGASAPSCVAVFMRRTTQVLRGGSSGLAVEAAALQDMFRAGLVRAPRASRRRTCRRSSVRRSGSIRMAVAPARTICSRV
jgi:hypothetical protein